MGDCKATQDDGGKSGGRCGGVDKDRPVEIGILSRAGHATHVKHTSAAIAKSNSTGSVRGAGVGDKTTD